MNLDNVNKAIAVMQRVKARGSNFDMAKWQSLPEGVELAKTEDRLHACGTLACFGGWLSVSPEWIQEGGSIDATASPKFNGEVGTYAIANWLDIPFRAACRLTHPAEFRETHGLSLSEEITVDHVIAALEDLRDEGDTP